ncbi:MAG: hypothetical protein HYZ89_03595 [Candidatus Omnitrophica bacterium]|nr:hypothetical protein [Candidatus Omnitrophota bacterium]
MISRAAPHMPIWDGQLISLALAVIIPIMALSFAGSSPAAALDPPAAQSEHAQDSPAIARATQHFISYLRQHGIGVRRDLEHESMHEVYGFLELRLLVDQPGHRSLGPVLDNIEVWPTFASAVGFFGMEYPNWHRAMPVLVIGRFVFRDCPIPPNEPERGKREWCEICAAYAKTIEAQ